MNPALKSLEIIAKTAADKFVKENAQDVAILGADAVAAIFREEVAAMMPALPEITAEMPIELRLEAQEIIETRYRAAQLIAAAVKQDSARVEKLRASAASVAGGVAKAVAVTGAGILLKMLAGG